MSLDIGWETRFAVGDAEFGSWATSPEDDFTSSSPRDVLSGTRGGLRGGTYAGPTAAMLSPPYWHEQGEGKNGKNGGMRAKADNMPSRGKENDVEAG